MITAVAVRIQPVTPQDHDVRGSGTGAVRLVAARSLALDRDDENPADVEGAWS
jgi:hypothetical protein